MITQPYTWIELNKHDFFSNLEQYKKVIGNAALSIVIKSNAYGHGLKEIAQLCQENSNVHSVCVVSLSEALTLRSYSFKKPILVLNLIDADPSQALLHNIDLTVYDKHTLNVLSELGKKLNIPASIHIKVDTGLSRFGFFPDQALQIITYAHQLPCIKINGLFTHCAEAEKIDQTFTLYQYHQYQKLVTAIEQLGIHIPYKHVANSAATSTQPLGSCNFVRVGAGTYGLWASEHTQKQTQKLHPSFQLKPVLTWKTKILELKNISAGSYVSYSRTFQAQRSTTLAFLPVGYYDGYDRRLSNCGIVGIKKANRVYYARVIGVVCMNTTSIDVTDIPGIKIGDEVILLGADPQLTATAIAEKIKGHNPREITTRLNQSIIRIIS